MNHFTSLSRVIATLACLISMQVFAQTPAEKTTAQIKKNATSGNSISAALSKNLLKAEEYQAPYTVQVPYQATENYTVEVPYQATEEYTVEVPYQVDETYTVQVPYQDTETYTENVPYTERVAYTDYETDYRDEYQCRNVTRYRNECSNVTRYRQECHNEQKCYLVPGTGGQTCRDVEECGTNAQGQRICKTRRVCDGNDGGPQQRCEMQSVCNNVPYTDRECRDVAYNDQECGNVRVPYQRQVTRYKDETRYRQETRTRTVTKYRNETRTRTVTKHRTETRTRTVTKTRTETRTREVTKYRDEERCCVTKTRQVFDRQLSFNVEVIFPQEAQLTGNESETLNVKLISADANSAQVQVDVVESIYGYKVASQTVNGSSVQVILALAPKYDLTNAGISTIKGLRIDYVASAQKFQVSFVDSLTSSRVQSAYALVISDLASGAQIEELAVGSLANGQLGAVVTAALDSNSKIKATLKVKRSGVLIANNEITFETAVNFEKRALIKGDVASLSDAKLVNGQVVGQGLESSFQLVDQTAEFSDVESSYDIFLTLKTADGGNQALKTTSITREALKQQGMLVKLSTVFKDTASAQKALVAGRVIKFSIHAKRKGIAGGILAGKSVQADVSGRFTLQ